MSGQRSVVGTATSDSQRAQLSARGNLTGGIGGFHSLIPDHLGIDIRALAAFRISVGILILLDLINRARYLVEAYTDAGILPVAALRAEHNPLHVSLHALSGAAEVQAALFLLAALAAMALILGVRTRLATVASWVLLTSLHSRNPTLLQSGDTLLRLYLFWGMFLSLGAAYSIDRALDRSGTPPPTRYRCIPALALLLQVVMVYVTAAAYKLNPVWLSHGSAVQHALMLEQYTTDFGREMLQFPAVLRAMTHGTIILELFGPLVLLSSRATDRVRVMVVAAFMLFHGSFMVLMTLGLFPLISMAGWLVFLPSSFWDAASRLLRSPRAASITIYYDAGCSFCRKTLRIILTFFMLREVRTHAAQEVPDAAAAMRSMNSWVVDTHNGRRLYRFEALAYLAGVSRVALPLAWIMQLPGVNRIGSALYRWLADRRSTATWYLRIFPWRDRSWSSRRSTEIIVLLLLGYVCLWNVAGMGSSQALPGPVRSVGDVLRLDQRWSMFGPYPSRLSGWWEVTGTLADGRQMDLLPSVRHARPVIGLAPTSVTRSFRSYRWRKYLERLRNSDAHARLYARHLCDSWKARFPDDPIDRVELRFHYRRTLPKTSTRSPPMTDHVLVHVCQH